MRNFLPSEGPKMPLRRFSHLASMLSCVRFALVCAENVKNAGRKRSAGRPRSRMRRSDTDLPVPVQPVAVRLADKERPGVIAELLTGTLPLELGEVMGALTVAQEKDLVPQPAPQLEPNKQFNPCR